MPDNNIIEKDLGPVSAWAIAKANGFDGTEAEWEALQANAAQNGSDAEAFAKGTRNGEAVASDDPAYHNNCAYHHAGTSADADTCTTKAAEATAAAATASAAYNVNLLAPNYSAESTYAVGDHVIYNGGYYECISAISTAEAWTAAHWRQLTVGGESADLKSALKDEQYCSRYMLTEKDYLTLDSKYIAVNGSVADSGNHVASDFIFLLAGDVITYTLRGSNDSIALVYRYDANKNPIANVAVGVSPTQSVSGTYTMPTDGYVRISNRKDFSSAVFKIGDSGKLIGIKALIAENLQRLTEITSGQDLNGFTTIGRYFTSNYTITNSLSNCPLVNVAINLDVKQFSDIYKIQEVTGRDKPFISYKRIYNGSTFTDWILSGVDEFGMFNARMMLTADDVLTDDGKYINYSTETEVQNPNYVLSTLIPVCKDDVIHYDLSGPSGVALVTAFRYDGSVYGTLVNGTSAAHTTGSVTCNGKYQYIKICNRKTYPGRSFYINQSVLLPQGAKTYIDQQKKDNVPYYWESNIASAITRYYAKNVLVGRSGVSFIFITDTHTVDNFCKSPALINYLYENTNIVNIVHGGDFIRNGQAESLEFENKFLSYLELLPVLGNHDVDSSVSADDENAYAYIFRRYENRYVDRDGFSYCFDIESQKMRFIMLDYRYNSSVTYLENHVKEGYKHIIFNHCYWWSYNSSTQEYTVSEVAQAIAEKADDLKSGGYDICAMIVGHIHQDKDTVTSGGIPIIATNCDAAGQSAGNGGRTMEGNTDSEQCFDIVNVDYVNSKLYFTRVGAGGSDADRTFDY